MIQTKGFIIIFAGDPSVGIFSSRWEVDGEMYFDSQEDFDEFVEKLKDAWEIVRGERVQIITFEAYEQSLEQECGYERIIDSEMFYNEI